MVDVPRDVRLRLFPKFLKRGSVLWVQRYQRLATGPRDKYIVLLNREFREGAPIHHVLTTSQVEKLRFPQFSVVLPQGTVPFFPLATAIQCREVHPEDYDVLLRRYGDSSLDFKGVLPAAVLAKIDAILTNSEYLSPKIAREILP